MAKAVNLKAPKAISNGALKNAELPTRIKVLNWGQSKTLDDPIFLDEESAEVFYANQQSIGRKLVPIDFNHNTVKGTQAYDADKEPRAVAGYGVPTIIPNDGLYLDYIKWTPSGEKSARDYADLSPAVACQEKGRVIGLHSVALTPAGAIEGLSFYSADSMSNLMVFSSDVEYADTKNKKLPLCTDEHVRQAWDFLQSPANQKDYSAEEIEKFKKKISAKAAKYGIQLRAESADANVKPQVDAYAVEPYEQRGIDNMLGEELEYFRKKLGLGDDAKPDDVMKALRAKWEGIDGADKETLPFATPNASVDPQIRNDGPLANGRPGQPQGIIKFTAEIEDKITSGITAATESITKKFEEHTKALTAELEILRTERNQKAKDAEETERNSLISDASRDGKVIPLSAEEVKTVDIKILRSIVANAKPEVPMEGHPIKPLSATESKPELKGSLDRAKQAMTRWFSTQGIRSTGKQNLNPRPMGA